MKQALQAKADKTLNTLVRYEEGIMKRREWIELKRRKGAVVFESTKPRIEYNRIKFNRMSGREQVEYEKKCNEKVLCYCLKENENVSSYFEITKTEFDYFNSLNN